MARRLAAIMFTDIAGFTAMTQADETGALRLLQDQERLVRSTLVRHHGRKVKSIGDGLLIEFPNALDAVECAIELQRRFHERNAEEGVRPLLLRVGIHLGDVQRRGTDIVGDAVNIAARVEPLAEPGGVCLSEPVYVQVRNKLSSQFEKLESKGLKGVREPLDIYRIVLPWATREAAAEGLALPRLAVLPLANISPDPKDEYFADGLTEELISVLSQARGLRVIARTSVSQYKATPKPIPQIASELGVDSVLEGSVRKAGEQLRITVQLIDARTQEHRWAQTFDRRLENVFEIQTEVAEKTASALRVELLKSEKAAIERRPTSNLVAYESYLRGIQAFQRQRGESAGHEKEEVYRKAVSHLEEAIREDARFSEAYSYLAHLLLALSGDVFPASEIASRVRELIAKALELNPDSSDAHSALGNLAMQIDLDWPRAEAELQQAISLNPSNAMAHFWYGFLLHCLHRFKESGKQYLAAIELDPLWLLPKGNLAETRAAAGDIESAIGDFQRLVERFPESQHTRVELAWLYALAGRTDEALGLVEAMKGPTELMAEGNRYAVLAYLGRSEGVRAQLAAWEEGRSTKYLSLYHAAELYASFGEKEKAIGLLEKDVQTNRYTVWGTGWGPWLDSIRADSRFVAMLRKMKRPATLTRPLRMPATSRREGRSHAATHGRSARQEPSHSGSRRQSSSTKQARN